jgi:hypothetical protein
VVTGMQQANHKRSLLSAESSTAQGSPKSDDKSEMGSIAPLPPLTLVYTCRNVSELRVLLPLLKYSHAVSIHIFYTGKVTLKTHMLHMPQPLPSPAAEGLGITKTLSYAELGSAYPGKPMTLGLRLPKMIADRGLHFTLFFLTFFAFFWANVRSLLLALLMAVRY